MLTDVEVRKAKPAAQPYKLTDGGGLHVYVTPKGSKLWRLRYAFSGKEKLLSLGAYPGISLADARVERDAAKRLLKEGRDPGVAKKLRRQQAIRSTADTFEAIAREWCDLQKASWVPKHAQDVIGSLEKDVFAVLGKVPIRDIDESMVLHSVLRPIEKRGALETAKRIRQRISAVFVYAIATGHTTRDPAAIIQGAMAPRPKGKQPAVIDLDSARTMLRKIEETPGHPVTKLANRLLALTALRPGALRGTLWTEFSHLDVENPVWQVPAERMKLRAYLKDDSAHDHLIPLSTQAIETIEAVRRLTGRAQFVFPNNRHAHKPMSENAIGYLMNRAGYHHHHVPHGWRATFSTIMNERHPDDHGRKVVDLMLAHVPKDKVESAYNRAAYLPQRMMLAQEWADLLMEGMSTADDLLVAKRR